MGNMVIGMDEAGRGPVIGPMVVCALNHDEPEFLEELGVKDSKLLSPQRREEIERKLKKSSSYSLLVIPAGAIDASRERMTLNRLEVLSFSSAAASLLSGSQILHPELPKGIRVDVVHDSEIDSGVPILMDAADVNAGRFAEGVALELEKLSGLRGLNISAKHRADTEYPIVGAASILAKVERDRLIDEISRELGASVGSGYPGDRHTREFLVRWVEENGELPPHCRRSWETARKILGERDQTSLLSFD